MNSEQLDVIIKRIGAGTHTATDVETLRMALSDRPQDLQQLGKYNIIIGEAHNVHIGDRIYYSGSDEVLDAVIQQIRVFGQGRCDDRGTLEHYLQNTLDRLKQQGCLDIRQDVVERHHQFNYVARISDFEFPFGPLSTRGEAFFLFSEFADLKMAMLQKYAGECLRWVRQQVHPKAAGQAFYNFRVPTHLCFAIALVDQLDGKTRTAIQTTNPIDRRVDILWYEVPVVFELSQQALHFYGQPTTFFDNFKGEIVWKQLRAVIQELLSPAP